MYFFYRPFLKILFDVISDGKCGQCTICMEEMQRMDILTSLPCLHAFHQECIIGWLAQVRNMILEYKYATVSIERC